MLRLLDKDIKLINTFTYFKFKIVIITEIIHFINVKNSHIVNFYHF